MRLTVLDRLTSPFSMRAKLRHGQGLIEHGKPAAGFRMLAAAAKSGLPEAQFQVGRCYLAGMAAPRSVDDATAWLTRAGNAGHAAAQAELAALSLQGLARSNPGSNAVDRLFGGTKSNVPDYDTAFRWARAAAKGGSKEGAALLAYIYACGPDSLRNLDMAEVCARQAAGAGNSQGALALGIVLSRKSQSVEVRREAIVQLERAAAAGFGTANYLLGLLLEGGAESADMANAARHFREAAQKDLPAAQFRWGLALLEGRGVPADEAQGEYWLRRAARAGETKSAVYLGDRHARSSNAVPCDTAEAAIWYERAAENGDPTGARRLANMRRDEDDDLDDEARWLIKAANLGDTLAVVELANLQLDGVDLAAQAAFVRERFAAAADRGDPLAAFNFGLCFANGIGGEKDDQKALLWLRFAAERLPDAQLWFGRMLAEGRAVPANPEEARIWLARAASAGSADAMTLMAELTLNGRGGSRHVMDAKALFEKAAQLGHPGAMYAIGALNAGGHGEPEDQELASRWFRRAAEGGHPFAQLTMGRRLAAGIGVAKNCDEASRWFEAALRQGLKEAQSELNGLGRTA